MFLTLDTNWYKHEGTIIIDIKSAEVAFGAIGGKLCVKVRRHWWFGYRRIKRNGQWITMENMMLYSPKLAEYVGNNRYMRIEPCD